MALPFTLHMLLSQSVATEKAYATALVLIFYTFNYSYIIGIDYKKCRGKLIEYITDKKILAYHKEKEILKKYKFRYKGT